MNAVLARPYRCDIGVVVLTRENSGVYAPDQSGPDAWNLVGCNLLTIARAPKHNSQGFDASGLVRHDAARGCDAEAGVVIHRVEFDGSVVDHFVALVAQMVD
jgi:hypothetical protein